ncbi:MAG TPA: phosphatidylglycerol lysyltransferase domain-containing protein [Candidatus Saccharimonadales bacterium]
MAFLTKLSKTKKQIDDHLVFEKFGPEHFTEYQDFISRFPQHCDFALNNLMVWMAGNTGLAFCWLNGNIVLRISGSIYENQLDGTWYTVLGDSDADNTLEQLFTWLNTGTLLMVPDYFVSALEHPERYSIVEDADNRDYILDIDTLIQRSGKKYENFRYQISYVIKNYSHESVIKELDLSKEQDVLLIINSMHTWSHITSFADGANDEYKVDAIAIDRLFQLQHILPIKHRCLGLFIEGKLQAFSIYHVPHSRDSIALGNHIKSNGEYKRLFDFMAYVTATRLKTEGIQLFNAEQDMGLEGLRHHKSYLNPVTFYKKYNITKL